MKGLTVEQSGNIWHNDGEKSLLTTSVWITCQKNTCVLLSSPLRQQILENAERDTYSKSQQHANEAQVRRVAIRAVSKTQKCFGQLNLSSTPCCTSTYKRTFNHLDTCYFKQSLWYNDIMLLVTVVTHRQTSQSSWNGILCEYIEAKTWVWISILLVNCSLR